jgi:hypothetical protein
MKLFLVILRKELMWVFRLRIVGALAYPIHQVISDIVFGSRFCQFSKKEEFFRINRFLWAASFVVLLVPASLLLPKAISSPYLLMLLFFVMVLLCLSFLFSEFKSQTCYIKDKISGQSAAVKVWMGEGNEIAFGIHKEDAQAPSLVFASPTGPRFIYIIGINSCSVEIVCGIKQLSRLPRRSSAGLSLMRIFFEDHESRVQILESGLMLNFDSFLRYELINYSDRFLISDAPGFGIYFFDGQAALGARGNRRQDTHSGSSSSVCPLPHIPFNPKKR